MEVKNGVGFKDGYLFVRAKGRDFGPNNRAVRLVNTETGDTYDVFEVSHPALWQEENVVEFLNLVEPKQLPNEAGSVIRNVRTERHIYNEAVLAANGEWRVASKDSRERKLGAIFSQAIIEWEEV